MSYQTGVEFVRSEHVQNNIKLFIKQGKGKSVKKVLVSTAVACLLVIIITGIGSAALPRAEASGNFITTSTTIQNAMEDKFNTIITLSSTVTYTGTLEGTSTLQGTLIVYRDGSTSFQGLETFTGAVDGIPGTLTFKLEGKSDLYQAIQINNVITEGTGRLASFRGKIFKTGIIKDNGPEGTYTGQIRRDDPSSLTIEISAQTQPGHPYRPTRATPF